MLAGIDIRTGEVKLWLDHRKTTDDGEVCYVINGAYDLVFDHVTKLSKAITDYYGNEIMPAGVCKQFYFNNSPCFRHSDYSEALNWMQNELKQRAAILKENKRADECFDFWLQQNGIFS